MLIKFKEIGSSFGTRTLGKKIREKEVKSFNASEKVIFDFEDVELISNSFADECFGKLIEEFGLEFTKNMTTFKNANNLVALVLKKAINDRIKKNKICAIC